MCSDIHMSDNDTLPFDGSLSCLRESSTNCRFHLSHQKTCDAIVTLTSNSNFSKFVMMSVHMYDLYGIKHPMRVVRVFFLYFKNVRIHVN